MPTGPDDGRVDPVAMPEATILVVTYAHAQFVEQCLESVRRQTVPVRLVLVDDSSPDETLAVVDAWRQRTGFPVEVIAHTDNRGLGESLSEGLARVRTPFFAYLSGDDWMEPDRVALQTAALRSAGSACALCYSDVYRADEEGRRLEPTLATSMGEAWKAADPDPYRALLHGNWIPAPSMMVRTESLRAEGGYDPEIFYEDHDVALRLARHHTLTTVDRPVATHRELSTSLGARMFLTEQARAQWLRARILIYRKHLGSDPAVDHVVTGLMSVWLRELYLRGQPARWVAARSREIAAHRAPTASQDAVLRLASARVPGRLVGRALGLPSLTRRILRSVSRR